MRRAGHAEGRVALARHAAYPGHRRGSGGTVRGCGGISQVRRSMGTRIPGTQIPGRRARGKLVRGMRVLGIGVLGMRVLGMRVLAALAPGRRVLGRKLPRSLPPVLIAAAALLAVAAGSAGAGGPSPAPTAANTALWASQPGSPAGVTPAGENPPPPMAPPRTLLPADLLVVSQNPLPAAAVAKVRAVRGVRAAELVDAARVRVNGSLAAVLGVDPSSFRRFAAKPTAMSTALWRNVADGAIAVSYTMGQQAKLPAGSLVSVAGRQPETLRVGGLGTVGIAGVNAVVSDAVARSLGFPVGNAIVISAPGARLSMLRSKIKAAVPRTAAVELLVAPAVAQAKGGNPGVAAAWSPPRRGAGGLLSQAQVAAFLKAAVSRVGMPYVWGAAGPASSTAPGWCSGRSRRRA